MKISEALLHVALQNYMNVATTQQKNTLTEAVASITSCGPIFKPDTSIDVLIQKLSKKKWEELLVVLQTAQNTDKTVEPKQCLAALIDKIKRHISSLKM